jgi:hypothetical protein
VLRVRRELPAIAKLGVVVPSDFKMLRITVDNLISVGVKLLAARQIVAKSGGNNAVRATRYRPRAFDSSIVLPPGPLRMIRFAMHGPATRKSQLKKLGLELGRRLTAFD